MTVQEFITAISKAKDIDLAEMTFVIEGDDERCFEVKSMSQFGISTDVTVHLQEFVPPMIKPLVVQRDKQEMLDQKLKEIKNDTEQYR